MSKKFETYDRFPSNLGNIFVDWDKYQFGEEGDLVWTDSVACCLAITLYNPLERKGILAHISGFDRASKEVKPENIMKTLLAKMNVKAEDMKKLEATLAGEGTLSERQRKQTRNSDIVRKAIQSYGIPIIGEDLVEAPGRLVFLDCSTGKVEVYRPKKLSLKELVF